MPLPKRCLVAFCSFTAAFVMLVGGCTTAWKEEPAFYRVAQAHLSVTSTPPGRLYVNNRFIGVTPVSTYLDCEEEIKRRTRNVSYYQEVMSAGFKMRGSRHSSGKGRFFPFITSCSYTLIT